MSASSHSSLTKCLLENLKGQVARGVWRFTEASLWQRLQLLDNLCLCSSKTGFQPALLESVLAGEANDWREGVDVFSESK